MFDDAKWSDPAYLALRAFWSMKAAQRAAKKDERQRKRLARRRRRR